MTLKTKQTESRRFRSRLRLRLRVIELRVELSDERRRLRRWLVSSYLCRRRLSFSLDDERECDRRCLPRVRCRFRRSESESDSTGSNGCRWRWVRERLDPCRWDLLSSDVDLEKLECKTFFFCCEIYLRLFSWRNAEIRSCSARVFK